MEILIEAFSIVTRHEYNIKLLVVKEGNGKSSLEELAHECKVRNDVIFAGHVCYWEMPSFIAAAAVCVSPIPPLRVYEMISPPKMLEYMAMAKPAVANEEIPEHKEVLDQSEGGVLFPFASGAFAKACIQLLDNPRKAAKMGRRGREWLVTNRSYERLARRAEERYYRLVGER